MKSLKVSDHALLRLLERGADLDIEGLRKSLEQSLRGAHLAAASIGATNYLIHADGLAYVVRKDKSGSKDEAVVVTVLERKSLITSASALDYDGPNLKRS